MPSTRLALGLDHLIKVLEDNGFSFNY